LLYRTVSAPETFVRMIKSRRHRFATVSEKSSITEQLLHKGAGFFFDHLLELLLSFIF
jgi:hypothetical protein